MVANHCSGLCQEPSQVALYAVNPCQKPAQFECVLKPPFRIYRYIEILKSHKQQPPRSVEQFVVHDFSDVAVNETANKGELVVEELDENA